MSRTTQHLANVEIFAAVVVLGLSLILSIVSLMSYGRLRNRRALLIGLGFLAFALQGAYLVRQAWVLRGDQGWVVIVALTDLLALGLLYAALRIR